MKRITFIFALFAILLAGCEKKQIETAGNIPGMGEAEGELEVTPYEFPEEIEFVGEITGYEETAGINANKSTECINCSYTGYGCGGQWVRLKLTVKNTSTTHKRSLYFPKGLVCKVDDADYQHGILLQWVWVCLQPGETRTIPLNFMCVNKGRNGSSAYNKYQFIGVTTSNNIWKLLTYIGWRKVNIEHYIQTVHKSTTATNDVDYNEIATNLQEAVWAITNGSGLTQEQIDYIESLPEMEEGTYPAELEDATVEPPYYFDEYTPAE